MPEEQQERVRNAVTGSVGGALVQAGTVITGGVHVHHPRGRRLRARLVTAVVVPVVVATGLVAWPVLSGGDDGPPLVVRVRPVPEGAWVWVLPGPVDEAALARVALTSVSADRDAGFRALGGVPSADTRVLVGGVAKAANSHRISLVGNRDGPVRVIGVRTRVLRRAEPWTGALVALTPQGEHDVRQVVTDLDDPDGAVLLRAGPDDPGRPYLEVKAVTVARGEDVVIQLTAAVGRSHCEWELELTVGQGSGPDEVLRVRADGTDSGPAFTTTAWDSAWRYRGGRFRVIPVDPPANFAFERVG
ncbi:hypothetical protein [Actinokineospora globicatena]|uniref:Uncharacterized protein n=1 Tax=Actinokineospora globicatena TaxID=103729 RepID=A0A9W6QJD3_9PSEU|nr:hypothetical protein [Actinokineospora globicatena]GLW90567.1 hypothetical protein Aglo03_13830 [Actinokineospora globicatena]